MKQKKTCVIGVVLCGMGFAVGSGCAHSTTKPRSLVFKDPQAASQAQHLQEQIDNAPKAVATRLELGRLYLSEEMYDEAISVFAQVVAANPKHTQAMCLQALAFQKQPKPNLAEAAAVLIRAVETEPGNGDIHLHLAQVYDKLKEETKALQEFQTVIELSREPATLVSAHLGLMAIYQRRGDAGKAQAEHAAARIIYPGVDEMLKEAEIGRRMPPPQYGAGGLRDGDGLHPALEERIRRLREQMQRDAGGNP